MSVNTREAKPAPASNEHRTVSRVMTILELVIANEPSGLRLADLPEMLDAPKSSIHGLARGLVATGYLREHQGRYFQGPAVAMLAFSGQEVPAAFHHALEELVEISKETAILATLAGDTVINIDIIEPQQMIRATPPLHVRRPLWPNSYGKVFLAHMSEQRRNSYLRRKHADETEQEQIRAELETIRTSGFAVNKGEADADLYGVACPIVTGGSDVTLAIGVAGPASRIADRIDEIALSVQRVAQELSPPN
ncbi:IclR family transcriptional regulator [Gordonia hydrophobica]|uniref:IclR family transcriptional regulator n=1 Tax=Gordonia hydrophobica TaxID=40516 RepID=A0ABZ2U6Z1_9ACTN|nr:IclR family transcriptional regulator [Gordonia hydrophobica]MBM7365400.1 DNA-binding IclR family transcriptional regulator [Gordonia hydrophobica]